MSKKQSYLEVSGTSYKLPVTVIEGGSSEETFLFSAGVHGCEYVGIEALKQWAAEIDPNLINGKVVCLHVANPSGFANRVPELVPEDGKNLNRVFPGNQNGTESEILANFITKHFHLKADYYVDFHSGDVHENVMPFVYFVGIAEESVVEKSRQLAMSLNYPVRVRSGATTGAYNSAGKLGIPSILIERGGRGLWSQDEVDAYKNDINTLLIKFGFLRESEDEKLSYQRDKHTQVEITCATYINSPCAGWWYPKIDAGDLVNEGDCMGIICDDFGNLLTSIEATKPGRILYLTRTLALKKNEALIAYSQE